MSVKLALPAHERLPAEFVEFLQSCFIAYDILFQLRFPVIEPGFGELSLGASVAVPEAAVDENRLAPASEHYIRPTGQVLAMEAIAVSHGVKTTPDDHLRPCVTAF